MRKCDELVNPTSCTNRANDKEMMFVLLGRDPIAPVVIKIWAMLRILTGKNEAGDRQTTEAYNCAHTMEIEREIK